MKILMTAIALTIVPPAAAHAQAGPAAPPKAQHSGNMMDCNCCNDMAAGGYTMKGSADAHPGHDMSKSGAQAPQAEPAPKP